MWQTVKKQIPNTLTSCNLFCGCLATYAAFLHDFRMALLCIVAGATFDFFDGMMARLLGVSSPIGLQLDSLADDITFGLAPATLAFSLLQLLFIDSSPQSELLSYIPYLGFLIAVFSALRLAKFNVDTRQTTSFIGLPTPANALFWGGIAYCFDDWALLTYSKWIVLALVIVMSGLLVAELPMFSLKFKHFNFKDNRIQWIFLAVCILLLLLGGVAGLSLCILWYILLSLLTSRKG